MLTAELLRQMDTKHFISVARMHASTLIEHEALDRLEAIDNALSSDARILADMLDRHVLALGDLADEADVMADMVKALRSFKKD